jgi:hypothetical protein
MQSIRRLRAAQADRVRSLARPMISLEKVGLFRNPASIVLKHGSLDYK